VEEQNKVLVKDLTTIKNEMNEIKKGINVLAGKSNKTENESAKIEENNQGMSFSRNERMDLAKETFENLMNGVLEVVKVIETSNIMEPKLMESNRVKKGREEVETLLTTMMEYLKIIDDKNTKELENLIKEKELKQEKELTDNKEEDKIEEVKEKESNKDTIGAYWLTKEKSECFNTHSIFVVEIPVKEHKHPDIIEVKEMEIRNLQDFNTFEEVKDTGQTKVGSRWVVTGKEKHDGQKTKYKA
jgi:hypothetical protein